MYLAHRSTAAAVSLLLAFNPLLHAAPRHHQPAFAETAMPSSPMQAPPTNAPVPTQIASARKVMLTNAGTEQAFPGAGTEGYDAVYGSLKSWGRFTLVDAPADADLIFQLRSIAPITSVSGAQGNANSYTSPAFQLTIIDPKTNVALWTVTSPVHRAVTRKGQDHKLTVDAVNLVTRIKALTGDPLTPAEKAELKKDPEHHSLWRLIAGV